MAQKTIIIVPCYNEAGRLPVTEFLNTQLPDGVSLLFVNDGSLDETQQILEELASQRPQHISVLQLEQNSGKAEAVRQGMLAAIEDGATVTGFLDADLATPLGEMFRLLEAIKAQHKQVALASRVRLLGTEIHRRPTRHYLGRVFATLASFCLKMPIYDTQCGAKVFRVTHALKNVLAEPFLSRWAFDVELIGRLLIGDDATPRLCVNDFLELPIMSWQDVRGSKLRLVDFPRMGIDLVRIGVELHRRRKQTVKKSAISALPRFEKLYLGRVRSLVPVQHGDAPQ